MASVTPYLLDIKSSTKNLRCFYTATATESDVTLYCCTLLAQALIQKYCMEDG